MLSFLSKPGVVHHPRHQRSAGQYGGEYRVQHGIQNGFITPRRIGYQVMQRLVHAPHIVWRQASRHRFDALALAG
jgi:hypothetical protein